MQAGDAWAYLIIWEFRPKAGMERMFEQTYGPGGIWAEFFRRGEGYVRTELTHDANDPGRYLTLDFWISRESYEQFRDNNLVEYGEIDQLCEEMTQAEVEIGRFERLKS
ncbi:MAG: hypothetical protein DMG88_05625 [Acidobacteria bacterium]|nr:MAG: hypothetical protein DMG88_05625 [Acidobacteriota bacterium]